MFQTCFCFLFCGSTTRHYQHNQQAPLFLFSFPHLISSDLLLWVLSLFNAHKLFEWRKKYFANAMRVACEEASLEKKLLAVESEAGGEGWRECPRKKIFRIRQTVLFAIIIVVFEFGKMLLLLLLLLC